MTSFLFLTSVTQIEGLCRRLRNEFEFARKPRKNAKSASANGSDVDTEVVKCDTSDGSIKDSDGKENSACDSLNGSSEMSTPSASKSEERKGEAESPDGNGIAKDKDVDAPEEKECDAPDSQLYVLPLYSVLPSGECRFDF